MSGEVDDAVFRSVLGRFASGVTVVTTVADGVDHAMTASAFCSVSMNPPLVLVCVDLRNLIHDAMMSSKSWGVSLLGRDQRDAATWLARRGRPLEGQLEGFEHRRSEITGAALLTGALGWLDCHTWASYDGGDHTIVVGEVLAAEENGADGPLLHYRSDYREMAPPPEPA